MIETRRSARQKHAKNSVIYVKPVKPIGQTVEKNYEFLIKTSLENKESKKTNGARFRVQTREIQSKQDQVLRI